MTKPNNAIILIHGIGDQEPKSTLDAFVRAVANETGAAPSRTQTVHTSRAPHASHDFAYFVDKLNIHGEEYVVAEMFWSKLSPVASGFMSNISNFFRLVANAPDIVYACLGPRAGDKKGPRLLRLIRSVLAFAFWIIYFPIVALNIAYAVLFLEFIVEARVFGRGPANGSAWQFLGASLFWIVVALYVLRWLTRKARAEAAAPVDPEAYATLSTDEAGPPPTRKSRYRYARALSIDFICIMAFICAVSIAGLAMGANKEGKGLASLLTPVTYEDYAVLLGRGLTALWIVPIGVDLLFLALLPFIVPFFRSRWRGLLLGSATAYMITRFWIALLTSGWLTLLSYGLNDPKLFNEVNRPLLVSTRGLSLVWLDLIALTIGAAIVYAIYLRRSLSRKIGLHRSHQGRAEKPPVQYPRLLVPFSVLMLTIVLSAVWLVALYLCNCDPETCQLVFCKSIYASTLMIITYAAVLVGVGGILLQMSAGGFKIATDFVNYFRSDFGHRNPNPFAAIASAYNFSSRDSTYRTLRDRLNDMLGKLYEEFERDAGPFDRVVLIAHSLGTMIAISALHERIFGKAPRPRFELITMGSPYVNVFNHYFPHMFGSLDTQPLTGLSRWLNIYRENDYVGTHFDCHLSYMTESQHGAKGHLGYFSDPEVVRDIMKWLDEGTSTAPAAAA